MYLCVCDHSTHTKNLNKLFKYFILACIHTPSKNFISNVAFVHLRLFSPHILGAAFNFLCVCVCLAHTHTRTYIQRLCIYFIVVLGGVFFLVAQTFTCHAMAKSVKVAFSKCSLAHLTLV